MGSKLNVAGKRFGRLTALREDRQMDRTAWLCICDCGTECVRTTKTLRNGMTKSCGCFQIETVKRVTTKHGRTNSKLYGVWKAMRGRCRTKTDQNYRHYGGRGIKICERWNTFENFRNDMGDPEAGLTLDRIDVNGNYEPSNCRWVTMKEQTRNKRNSLLLTFNGKTQIIPDWAKELNLVASTLYARASRGLSVQEIFGRK